MPAPTQPLPSGLSADLVQWMVKKPAPLISVDRLFDLVNNISYQTNRDLERRAAIGRKARRDKYQVLEHALQAGEEERAAKIVADWSNTGEEELALAFECAVNENLVKAAIYLYPLVPDDAQLLSDCYQYQVYYFDSHYPLCIAASHGYLDLVNYFISQSADTSMAAMSAIEAGLPGKGNEWMIQLIVKKWPLLEEHATLLLHTAVAENRSALVVSLARRYRFSNPSIAELIDYAVRKKRSPDICHALFYCKARMCFPFLDGHLAVCLCIGIWLIRHKIKQTARCLKKARFWPL